MTENHSFEIRPGDRSGLIIGSRVRWVDPNQPGSTQKKLQCSCLVAVMSYTKRPKAKIHRPLLHNLIFICHSTK